VTQEIIDTLRNVAARLANLLGDRNLFTDAADHIAELREQRDEARLAYRGACYDRDQIKVERDEARRERDEARLEVCQLLAQFPGAGASEGYAEERGWQYLNEQNDGK
jgi:hypothetical protein